MAPGIFSALFDTLSLPVLAARTGDSMPVVYRNEAARKYFRNTSVVGEEEGLPLEQALPFQNPATFSLFKDALAGLGPEDRLGVAVLSFQDETKLARVYGGRTSVDGVDYYVVHLTEEKGKCGTSVADARSRDIFRTIVDNLEELVYITDLETYELKFVSKSLARALGRSHDELVGRVCWEALHRGRSERCAHCPVPRLLSRGLGDTASSVSEMQNRENGKWYMVKSNIIDWIDGSPVHLGALVDISYRKQYEEQLKRSAATDSMTDVYNRKWGRDKLLEQYDAPGDDRLNRTLCFLDMDGLKRVNDTLGHAAGDEMIINTIQTIFSCIRKDDFIIRWGGDEFVVFLNCNMENAEKVLGKILFGFEHFNSTRNRPYRLSASAGLVNFAEPFACLDGLVAEADRRMYQNKLAKRNRTGVFLR